MTTEKNADKILIHLKMNGKQTASELAGHFRMSTEGMRLHLLKLEENGLVAPEIQSRGVGRPVTLYSLTQAAARLFPDNHATFSAQLLRSVRDLMGEEALQTIVRDKQSKDLERYGTALEGAVSLEEKLDRLTDIRTIEGYMAEWSVDGGDYLFVENNCPICSAAIQCGALCQAELENISRLLGEKITMERTDHTTAGDRRCCYRIHR